jgi:hypothetical protein
LNSIDKYKGVIEKELEEKNIKHVFSKYKMHFFLLDPSNFQSPYLYYFFFNYSDLKCYESATLRSTNHFSTLKAMEQLPGIVFNVQE